MNSIKAHIVESLNDYPWSSYAHHALAKEDVLISEHHLYQALGENGAARCEAYKALFDGLDITKQNERITQATMRGEVYGSNGFHQRIEKIVSRRTKLVAHGGDRKSETYRNQAG
jgi:putative transposase